MAQSFTHPVAPANTQDYIPLSSLSRVVEDFNTIGTTAEATMPAGWRVDKQNIARRIGNYTTAQASTEHLGGNNLTDTAPHGIYNFGQNIDNLPPERAIGFLGGHENTKSGNLYVKLRNVSEQGISNLALQYNIEKYRQGNNPAGFAVQLYFSLDGQTWTSTGDNFKTTFAADLQTTGYADAPGQTESTSSTFLLPTPLAPGQDLYLAWNYSVSTGNDATNAQALAIDDFVLEVLDNSISLGRFAETEFCISSTEGKEFILAFTAGGNFAGNNVFTAQLSDQHGSFNNPLTIGSEQGAFSGNIAVQIPAGLPSGSAYRTRIISSAPQVVSDLSPMLTINYSEGGCSQPTDFFRSRQSGSWHESSTWQTSSNGTNWVASSLVPTYEARNIFIQSDHVITTDQDVVADRIQIKKGGTLYNRTGVFVISDHELIVEGTFIFESDALPALRDAKVIVKEKGTIEVRTNFENLAANMAGNNSANKYMYESGAIFYWNVNAPFDATNQTYFPMATAQDVAPVFKVGNIVNTSVGTNTQTRFNGIFELHGSITWVGAGQKTFRNGILSSGTLTQTVESGTLIINGDNAVLGGSGTLVLNAEGLDISSRTTLTLQSNKVITATNGGAVNLYGTLNAKTFSLQGAAGFNFLNGSTLITAHPQGFGGSLALATTNISDGITLVCNAQTDQNLNTPHQMVIETLKLNTPAKVLLNNPLIVSRTLALEQGKLSTTESAMLTIAAGASVTGASENNFVDGPMLKAGNTAFVFPVGKGNVYAPFGISAPLNLNATFKAEYIPEAYPERAIASEEIKEVSKVEHWLINRIGGTLADSVAISLYFYNRGRSGITNESFLRVVNFRDGGWQNLGPVVHSTNVITTTRKYSSFSPVTFGSTDPANPLPVTFISFEGKIENARALLYWSTASEKQNKGFEIERSITGTSFTGIGFIHGAGDSFERKNYTFTDPTPPQQAYYRLKQIDYDGSISYSETIFLRNTGFVANTMSLYPNPTAGNVQIHYEGLSNEEKLTLTLVQSNGSIALQTSGTLQEVNQQLNIALEATGRGFYIVEAVSIYGTTRCKLIRE